MFSCAPQVTRISETTSRNSGVLSGVKLATLLLMGASLAACTPGSNAFFGDQFVTGSTNTAAMPDNLNQAMPAPVVKQQAVEFDQLGVEMAQSTAPFSPAMPINGGRKIQVMPQQPNQGFLGDNQFTTASVGQPQSIGKVNQPMPVATSALPSINKTQVAVMPTMSNLGTNPVEATRISESKMSDTQKNIAPALRPNQTPDAVKMMPEMAANTGFTHTVSAGESLYAIARRYNVSTDVLVSTNKMPSPDRLFVGQNLIIPGQAKMPIKSTITVAQVVKPVTPKMRNVAVSTQKIDNTITGSVTEQKTTPVIKRIETKTQTTPIAKAAVKPAVITSNTFRWPVTGRVISDFSSTNDTGIAIEVPEGSMVRAAENGSVLYVGHGIEWYGNLVLVKHSNGLVSAYAHLKDITVKKGDAIQRGGALGTVGMTGAAKRPQLHFELRKGAKPVNPTKYLAS